MHILSVCVTHTENVLGRITLMINGVANTHFARHHPRAIGGVGGVPLLYLGTHRLWVANVFGAVVARHLVALAGGLQGVICTWMLLGGVMGV